MPILINPYCVMSYLFYLKECNRNKPTLNWLFHHTCTLQINIKIFLIKEIWKRNTSKHILNNSENKILNFCTNDSSNQSWDFIPFENSIEIEKFWYFCNDFFGSKLAKISKNAKYCIFPLVTKIFDRKMNLYVSSPVELKFNFPF